MSVYWTQDIAIGVDEIDSQHQELFVRMNRLIAACMEGSYGQEQAEELLRFLQDYTATHFADEEAVMLRYEYPDYAEHRNEHQQFKNNLTEFEKRLREEGASPELLTRFNHLLVDWLTDHISSVDRRLGKFILAAKG